MQHDKNTKKVEQVEKISQSGDEIIHSITSVMNKFGINKNRQIHGEHRICS